MSKLPETPEEIDEFIRAVDAGEIECPPAPNANLIARMCVTRSELDHLKQFIREEVLHEIYNQYGQNAPLIEKLRSMVSCENAEAEPPRTNE